MGQNFVLVGMNDALDRIERDSDFGRKVAEAVRELSTSPSRRRVDVPSGNHVNAAHVVSVDSADVTTLIAVGGNLGLVQAQVRGGNHTLRDVKLRLLRRWAQELGVDVVERGESAVAG
jgi:hypothetical protein